MGYELIDFMSEIFLARKQLQSKRKPIRILGVKPPPLIKIPLNDEISLIQIPNRHLRHLLGSGGGPVTARRHY